MVPNSKTKTEERIIKCGLIPIVRGHFSIAQVVAFTQTLSDCGVSVLEVTLNSTDALKIISELRSRFDGRVCIGAGTVRNLPMLRSAQDAGAEFTIAPAFDRATVEAAVSEDFLHLPGVLTPTEVEAAVAVGCRLVKLFPVDSLGSKYLKAIRAPLNDVRFIPTGGVTVANVAEFRGAGAVAVGIGSALVTGPDQSLDDLAQRGSAFRQAWDSAKP